MKLISCENVATNRYQLEVAVDPKDFNDAIERAYAKTRKKISLPGFRKGKAPRAFIEKYYGQDVFLKTPSTMCIPQRWTQPSKKPIWTSSKIKWTSN